MSSDRIGKAVMASANLGRWLSAALDDPNVCEEMKGDIRAWFSAGDIINALTSQLAERDARIAALTAAGDAMADYMRGKLTSKVLYQSDALKGWQQAKGEK